MTYDRKVNKIPTDTLAHIHRQVYHTSPETRAVLPSSHVEPQMWKYTTQKPGENWMNEGFDDSEWEEGKGVFGYDHPQSQLGMGYYRRNDPQADPNTRWRSTDIWLRKSITMEKIPDDLLMRVRHDDDARVYVNGQLVTDVGHRNVHYEHYVLFRLNDEQKSAFRQGQNIIAVHGYNDLGEGRHKKGANQSVDVGIYEMVKDPGL